MKDAFFTIVIAICLLTFSGCETARGLGQDIRSVASAIGSVLNVGRQIEDISN